MAPSSKTTKPLKSSGEQTQALTRPEQTPWAIAVVQGRELQLEIKKVLHDTFTPEAFNAIMTQALFGNPELANCDPLSVQLAILRCARLGIAPLGQVDGGWLIPRKGKAVFQISYDGLLGVVSATLGLIDVRTEIVCTGDEFSYEPSSEKPITHKVQTDGERGSMLGVWAQVRVAAEGSQVGVYATYLSKADVERRRRIGFANSPAWKNHYEAMARKTALHQVFKYMPKGLNRNKSAAISDDDHLEATAESAPPSDEWTDIDSDEGSVASYVAEAEGSHG